jgi:hypothetical protein
MFSNGIASAKRLAIHSWSRSGSAGLMRSARWRPPGAPPRGRAGGRRMEVEADAAPVENHEVEPEAPDHPRELLVLELNDVGLGADLLNLVDGPEALVSLGLVFGDLREHPVEGAREELQLGGRLSGNALVELAVSDLLEGPGDVTL